MQGDPEDLLLYAAVAIAAVLSYETPIYLARLVGREAALNRAWVTAFDDNLGSGLLFFAAWMAIGFAVWALPLVMLRKYWRPLLLFMTAPARHAWEARQAKREEQATLRQIWRTEFRGRFKTFEQFVAAVENGVLMPGDGPASAEAARPAPVTSDIDPYRDALTLLGLKADCGRQDLVSRYRTLAKQVHPDMIGENDMFRRLTVARDAIAARRGWNI